MKRLSHTKYSMKMVWGCVLFAGLAIVLRAGGVGAGPLFIIPCMLMMMMGGMGGAGRGRTET